MGNDPLRGRVRRLLEATDLEGPGDSKDEADTDVGSGRCVGADDIIGEEGGEAVKESSRQFSPCSAAEGGGSPCPCEDDICERDEDEWLRMGG